MMPMPLIFEQIRTRLRDRIEREWRPGTRLPTMPDLARMLDAGQTNTHRAVKALVAEGRLVARRGAGTYVAPLVTRSSAGTEFAPQPLLGKQVMVCLSVEVPGAMVAAMEAHFTAAITAAGATIVRRPVQLKDIDGRLPVDVDAMLVINPDKTPPIRFAPHQLLSIISTGSDLSVHASGRYDIVTVNQEQGGYLAGELARESGCKHPCYIGVTCTPGGPYDQTSAARLSGFEHGYERPIAANAQLRSKSYGNFHGAKAVTEFLAISPRPNVVFCASDELAVGFALGASSHGLDVGRDFRLIGFDRQKFGQELHNAQLTTVEVPVAEMGRRAADMLISRFAQPDQSVRTLSLGCSLALGNT